MRTIFLCLFFLTSLLVADAANAAKCKDAWCRWYEDSGVAERFGIPGWPDRPEHQYADFRYRDMLANSTNTIVVARYARVPDLQTQVSKRDYDPERLDWVVLDVRYSELYRQRGRYKKERKFWKKKRLVGDLLDVIYEIKTVDGLPVWRVHIRPLTFAFDDTQGGSKFLYPTRETASKFVAKLPDLSNTPVGEIRTSEWQFCEKCVADDTVVNHRKWEYSYDTQTKAKEGIFLPFNTVFSFVLKAFRFEAEPPVGLSVVSGSAAMAAVADVSRRQREDDAARIAENQRLAALAEQYKAERAAYEELVANVDDDGLPAVRKARCGDLKLIGAPDGNYGLLQVEDFEERASKNASRYGEHMQCVTALIDTYDYTARAEQLAGFRRELNTLYVASHFEDRDSIQVDKVGSEVQALNAYLSQQEQRLNNINRDYDRQWDVFLRAREQRREKKIVEEVDKCIAALYATQSLTPNSRNYCRRKAEQGYTGMSAAAGAFRGNRSSGSSGGNLTYQKPQMPTFDLNGMIANAKAVADGADSSVLWDEAGTIRTSKNPNLPVIQPQRQPVAERARSEPVASATAAARPETIDPTGSGNTASVPTPESTTNTETNVEDAATANASGRGINITVTTTIPTAEQMRVLDAGGSPSGDGVRIGAESANGSRASSQSAGTAAPGPIGPATEQQSPKNPAKYVWVEDVYLEERGFAFSSRDDAVRNLQRTWADNRLNTYCSETYEDSDAQKGVVTVDEIQVEQISSTRWVGSATVDGYCRILGHDESYDAIRMCVSERRGQPDCAVLERH